jgi:outer membrane PBP1 activator LpoA protein
MCKLRPDKRTRLWAVHVVALAAAGCATVPGPVTVVDLAGPEREAAAYAAAGDITSAVAVYADLYERATGSQRARYALGAAELLSDAERSDEARDWLRRADADANPAQQQRIIALTAQLALHDGDAQGALDWLARLDDNLEQSVSLRTMATRGRALFRLGRIEEAVRVLVERDLWLMSDADILANHELIWNGLRAQSTVRPMIATGDPVIDGWLALLPVAVETRRDPFGLTARLDQWQTAYPNHPAAMLLMPELREQDRLAQTYPEQIALLLPLRTQQQAAAAIRDGFLAAYLGNPNNGGTQIRIYDTDELGSQQAYLQAQLDGAAFIVGPLLKPAVEQIVASSGFVPTLALNRIDNAMPVPSNFFQFGLAPEDEASEVARHAIERGAQTAVALFPNSDWGLRLYDSFQREFASLGGRVLESRAYDTATQDFSLAITTLLNLNESEQRRQRLAANVRLPLEFEPRRRQDVDIIFFAASPGVARLLAPQFRFHFAGDLPTYATSDIYDTAARSDPDLNGVIFADTPWLLAPDELGRTLKTTLQQYWPQRASRLQRFYGLGFDAYRLVPMLFNGTMSLLSVPGLSGELWLDEAGRVRRHLPIAQFVNGRPVELVPEMPVDEPLEAPTIVSQR